MCDYKTTTVLAGDSIFDSAPYNVSGESVIELLKAQADNGYFCELIAVDGDVTTDVSKQLNKYNGAIDKLFISCGGNDALQYAFILQESCTRVHEAMSKVSVVLAKFRKDYQEMLVNALKRCTAPNIKVCTIYNRVPILDEATKTTLALFNEVILEEASTHNIGIIDLRVLCQDENDYAAVSPIEPSGQGGLKIAKVIHNLSGLYQSINSTPIYNNLTNAL